MPGNLTFSAHSCSAGDSHLSVLSFLLGLVCCSTVPRFVGSLVGGADLLSVLIPHLVHADQPSGNSDGKNSNQRNHQDFKPNQVPEPPCRHGFAKLWGFQVIPENEHIYHQGEPTYELRRKH